jgi:DNA polymerase (family 10)
MVEAEEDLSKLPGIGKDLADKIQKNVKTGSLEQLEEHTPAELNERIDISGLGPKRVSALYQRFGITNRKELEAAAENGKTRNVEGFGRKTEQAILDELSRKTEARRRVPLSLAEQRTALLMDYLNASKRIKKLNVAGSYRRCKETVGDLDILVTCSKDSDVMKRFAG